MRKYLAIFTTAWANSLTWRGAFWFYITLSFLPLVVYYFLWTSVFEDRAATAGYSYEELLTYAVVAVIFTRFTSTWPEYGVMENIREGTLVKYLVQPISYFGYYWMSRMSFRSFSHLINAPFLVIAIILLRDKLLLPEESWQWVSVGLAFLLAYGLQFFFGMILGLLSFWIIEARYFIPLKETLLLFVGGMALPYAFFPESIQYIFSALPFRYLAAFPVELYLGRMTPVEAGWGLGIGIVWLAGLAVIAQLMWRRGLRRFVAVGN